MNRSQNVFVKRNQKKCSNGSKMMTKNVVNCSTVQTLCKLMDSGAIKSLISCLKLGEKIGCH